MFSISEWKGFACEESLNHLQIRKSKIIQFYNFRQRMREYITLFQSLKDRSTWRLSNKS